MGFRRRVRQTAKQPLTREQLNYWSKKACKDSWEKVNGERQALRAEQEKSAKEFWMALLAGQAVEEGFLEDLEAGEE